MPMSVAKIKLHLKEDGYQLEYGTGDLSDVVGYGEACEFSTADGRRFLALVNFPDDEPNVTEAVTDYWCYEVMPVPDEQVEVVEEGEGDGPLDVLHVGTLYVVPHGSLMEGSLEVVEVVTDSEPETAKEKEKETGK